jgi:hypothetical protein
VVGSVLLVQFINNDGYDAWYAEFLVKGETKCRRIKVEDDTESVWEAVVEVSGRLDVARSRIELLRSNLPLFGDIGRLPLAVNTAEYRNHVRWLNRRKRKPAK